MAHAQKPDFVFHAKLTSTFKSAGASVLSTAEVCASAVVMLGTPCSEVVWRVLATHSIRQFPLHFPSCVSPCAITFQLDSTSNSSPNVSQIMWSANSINNSLREATNFLGRYGQSSWLQSWYSEQLQRLHFQGQAVTTQC